VRIWTTQSEEVINILIRDKVYKPDFRLSHGLGSGQMKGAYEGILKEYKVKNNIECDGLIFGISCLEDKKVDSIEQFRAYFENNKTFWDSVSVAGSNYAILELEISDNLNLLPLYFQDFIILGMRAMRSSEFCEYVKPGLKDKPFSSFSEDLNIAQQFGWTNDEEDFWGESLLNKIEQVHVHKILLRDVKGVYSCYERAVKEACKAEQKKRNCIKTYLLAISHEKGKTATVKGCGLFSCGNYQEKKVLQSADGEKYEHSYNNTFCYATYRKKKCRKER